MTQAQTPNNVEAYNDAKAVAKPTGGDTASDARNTLSTTALDLLKEGATAAGIAVGDTIINRLAGVAEGHIAEQVGADAGARTKSHPPEQSDRINKIERSGANAIDSIGQFSKIENKITDQDRKDAKAALEKGISALVPEADRKLQVAMQNAIIDGDMKKFGEVVKSLANDPEKLAKMVKEVNDQLKRNEKFGGVELAIDSKGNVLMYGEKGNTAVSVNPKTGEATLRAVERQADGSVVLKEGEIINKKPADVMKELADQATRSITQWPFNNFPRHSFDKFPMGELPNVVPNSPLPYKHSEQGSPKPNLQELLNKKNKEELNFTPLKELEKK